MARKKAPEPEPTPERPIDDFMPADGEAVPETILRPTSIDEIDVDLIETDPSQPRRHFDGSQIDELASSIRKFGLIQNIAVRKAKDGRYVVVDGERRFRAWNILRKKYPGVYDKIQVLVVDAKDGETAKTLSLLANIAREDLLPIERAEALQEYADRGMPVRQRKSKRKFTQQDIAGYLKIDRSMVSKLLSLNKLDPDIKDAVRHDARYSIRELAKIASRRDADTQKQMFNLLQKRLGIPLTDFGETTRQAEMQWSGDAREARKARMLYARLAADFASLNRQPEQNFKDHQAQVAATVLQSFECLEKLASLSDELSLDLSREVNLADVKEQLQALVPASQEQEQSGNDAAEEPDQPDKGKVQKRRKTGKDDASD